jgi:tagatose kinase
MPDVMTVGEILVEIMAEKTGQSFLEQGLFRGPFPSGAPAIFIDQAAKMGISAGIVAAVGDDDFGRVNTDRLKKDGVDTSRIRVIGNRTTGTAFVSYAANGDRSFIFHFSQSAAGMVTPSDVDSGALAGAKYLHVMGCSLSASDSLRDAIIAAVHLAKSQRTKISFDPNIRPELLKNGDVRKAFDTVLALTDVLLTGREEAMIITDTGDIDSAVAALKAMKIGTIVMKSASKGVTIHHGGKASVISPWTVEEVDPTGAGDCFDGAFIANLVLGLDPVESGIIANAVGAMSVTRRGPMEGTVTMDEVRSFLETARQYGD